MSVPIAVAGRAASRLPNWLGSIRTRLAVLYSTLVFSLALILVAGIYFGVAASLGRQAVAGRVVIDVGEVCVPFRGGLHCFVTPPDQQAVEIPADELFREFEKDVNSRALAQFRRYSFGALGLLFLASLLIGWVVAGRVLRPIGRITRVAQRIGATDLSGRINLVGPPDEIRDLADTFDDMLGRVEGAFESQRSFIHEASHELRNPIAVVRTNVEVALADPEPDPSELQDTLRVVGRAADRMSVLVDDLLTYARRESPAFREAVVDVAVLVKEAAAEFVAPAEARHLLLVADAEGGLLVNADPVALKQALANLLANAIRLAPPSSTVRVAAGLDGAWVWFAVADEGPGISDEDQVHVFDRFWRGDQPRDLSTSHSGLGLTIVRQIAKGHGGAVGLQSAVGYGSTFSVWLPAINAPVESYSPAPVAVSANVLNN